MLPSIFRKQELPEPSGDQAAGVTSWEASSGTCFSWCPPGDCIPLHLTHIFSGLAVTLQARAATPGEPPGAPGQPGTLGLCLDAAPPGPCQAGLLCLSAMPWGQVDHGCTWFRGAWAWFGLRGGTGKGFRNGVGCRDGPGGPWWAGGGPSAEHWRAAVNAGALCWNRISSGSVVKDLPAHQET